MTGALRVDADLVVESDDVRVDLWTEEGLLVVNVPSFRAARRLRWVLASIPSPPATGTGDSAASGAGPAVVDFPAELRVRRAPVARFGRGVGGGWLDERLLHRPGDVNWRGIFEGLLRRLG